MVLQLLPWLFSRVPYRTQYAAVLTASSHEGALGWDVGHTAWLLAGIICLRFAFNALLRGPTQRLAAARAAGGGGNTISGASGRADDGGSSASVERERDAMQGRRLLEEAWVTLGNTAILAAALFVMLKRNGGCWFLDTSTCLPGWPDLPADPAVKWYYNLELAWYCHMLLKPVLRYGLPDGRDMLIHHCATLALILVSYGTNLTRIGVVVLALFAVSNPLLHVAKICNQLSLGPLKIGGFLAFAAAFFVSRVVLVPWAVIKPAALDSRQQIPYAVEDFHAIYLAINALLVALYLMQLLWMRGIVRVLRSAAHHGSEAASQMSAKLDPAKRYAEHAEHAGVTKQQQQQQQEPAAKPALNGHSRPPANGKKGGLGQQQGPLPGTPSPADLPALVPGAGQQRPGGSSKRK